MTSLNPEMNDTRPRIWAVGGGKGGVGKSTSAALNAVFLAQKGFRVLIVSLDPAHNQSDIFQMKFSDKALKIASDISAIEVDQDKPTFPISTGALGDEISTTSRSYSERT